MDFGGKWDRLELMDRCTSTAGSTCSARTGALPTTTVSSLVVDEVVVVVVVVASLVVRLSRTTVTCSRDSST